MGIDQIDTDKHRKFQQFANNRKALFFGPFILNKLVSIKSKKITFFFWMNLTLIYIVIYIGFKKCRSRIYSQVYFIIL